MSEQRLKEIVGKEQAKWIKDNPTATLAGLRQWLQSVADDFQGFDGEAVIADHKDELGVDSTDYLSQWDDEDSDGTPVTFDYRACNVEEDLATVDELIVLVGESFKVSGLPS